MGSSLYFLCLISTFALVIGKEGFGPTDQDWGFVTVREDAHLFWWLHTTFLDNVYDRPLVIWLQGGPGGSSTEFGNFEEIGPLDLNFNARNTTWLNKYNLLFVDNPVGTGFSYTDVYSGYTETNEQIAKDFVVLMQGFLDAVPQFKNKSFYIFSESYGGKMTAEIALHLDWATKNGTLEAKLDGVGLGDSWISPVDSCLTWAPYLLNIGAIDEDGYNKIQSVANEIQQAVDVGDIDYATDLFRREEREVGAVSGHTDFYNVLTKILGYGAKKEGKELWPQRSNKVGTEYDVMQQVSEKLSLNRTWNSESDEVFPHLAGDFMKPVTDIVETLLNTTDIKVAIYNGQLDLIVDTPGTLSWVNRLKWPGSKDWHDSSRVPFEVDEYYEGFEKKYNNLRVYWVDRAGHMVPVDNPAAMFYILEDTIGS